MTVMEKKEHKGIHMAKTRTAGPLAQRLHTEAGTSPYDMMQWTTRSSSISNPDGSVVFSMDNVEVPEDWSQLATDIAVSKYFRKAGVPETGHEVSVRQLVHRVAHTLGTFGEQFGYFNAEEAKAFEDEIAYIMLTQRGAFNSPVFFNVGLFHEYGINGSGGNFCWDPETDTIVETNNAYERPQGSACFIQSVDDDLMSIFELVRNEARVFKYGSGSGTNFSKVRGHMEKLSGGGTSSGLMSFLEVFDRAAGATKSGGTTRRAAKMVVLDDDHPEIREFVTWKMKEERKVGALIAAGYDPDFNGEAYKTVSGQNSNNSVRMSDAFMKAVVEDGEWVTTARTTGEESTRFPANDLFTEISEAAWGCADPGVQFHDTINRWHTCKNTDQINASNPCSEFMFLDNSACNLASINLMKYVDEAGTLDIKALQHAVRMFILAQDIVVDAASYPTAKIARNSHDYRPLGLGYANLGTLLMVKGLPYDSDESRAYAGMVTSLITGEAYKVSSEISHKLGPFRGYNKNREPLLEVLQMHRDAVRDIRHDLLSNDDAELKNATIDAWNDAVEQTEVFGSRNSQTSLLAPTGTIGFLMDCDTTGVEPDYSLIKFKKLAGGGFLKIINNSVSHALKNLGYDEFQIDDIISYVQGSLTFHDAPHINRRSLEEAGMNAEEIQKAENALPSVMSMSQCFHPGIVGEDLFKRLDIKPEQHDSLLTRMGFSMEQINEAEDAICGRGTIEGAPHLAEEHLPVFDCANRNGKYGTRFIEAMGHIKMMAAVQPFLSGAISKTVNLPGDTSVEDIKRIFMESWRLGLKAVALYRDGCKFSQPLASKNEVEESGKAEEYKEIITELEEKLKDTQSKLQRATTPKPFRRKLPKKRRGMTMENRVGGHKIYLRTGEYEDGALGEIFLDLHKEGATFRSMMNMFAMSVSVGLQHGVPLDEFVDMFTFTKFEPNGMVDHPNIKFATSIVDFLFRVLAFEYLGRTDIVQVPPQMDKVEGLDDVPQVKATAELKQQAVAKATETKAEAPAAEPAKAAAKPAATGSSVTAGVINDQLSQMMGDAPVCDVCGNITVRNGSCYRCLVCGNSMGCS